MTSHSKSFSDLELAIRLPPPPRLIRSFRCDFRPIPYFLQDLLADAPCRSCSDYTSRLVDLLKNIQTYSCLDRGCEGRLWFEIRHILKKDLMSDDYIFGDGRHIRSLLVDRTKPKHEVEFGRPEFLEPLSPVLRFRGRGAGAKGKFEPLLSPTSSTLLLPKRQKSS